MKGEGIPIVLVVLVAGQRGQWRSRTAATVAGTPGLQRADAVPEMLAPGGARVLDRAQSPLRFAARRADGGDRRARRLQAVGKGNLVQLTCLSPWCGDFFFIFSLNLKHISNLIRLQKYF